MSTIGIAGRLAGLLLAVHLLGTAAWASDRWTEARANEWYARQGFLVGANYVPATAINELEMWQADTFDPKRIDLELGWAAAIGMNTMRVFLHDLAYQQDPEGFLRRVDTFLTIAQKHRIKPMLVLFDSVWDPFPALGPQRPPRPGVHNSGWLQSPGKVALEDPSHWPRLETYVKAVVTRFKDDTRVLAWDLWNEVDNMNEPAYSSLEPKNKGELVLALLPQVFAWARASSPTQPITSGLWRGGDWSKMLELPAIDRLQVALSDIVSFHSYDPPAQLEARITQLQAYKRPIICTEYMARGNGSTFQGSLPILKRHGVGAINWGLVQGKAQTHLPWDSWRRPYVDREPSVWFHEVFRNDGTPYDAEETALIRRLTTPARDEADPLARLRGGIWFVEQIQGGPIVEASRVTMTFGTDGRVAGSTSCNTYSAAYAITGDRLTITMPIASLRGCEAPLMAQEAVFLTALRNLARYELSDAGVLTLHTTDGPAFVARRR